MADYDVVLLVEQALTPADAAQVRSLHEGLDDPVTYHVLLPLEDAAARIEASMGSLSAGEMLASPLGSLTAAGATTGSTPVAPAPPIDALAAKVSEVDGREAIILTRPHVVAEFFHVDWTSRARRKIGVPVLHLLEHESLEEQGSGGGEGVTGV